MCYRSQPKTSIIYLRDRWSGLVQLPPCYSRKLKKKGRQKSHHFHQPYLGNGLLTRYWVAPKISSKSWNVVPSYISKPTSDFVPAHARSQGKAPSQLQKLHALAIASPLGRTGSDRLRTRPLNTAERKRTSPLPGCCLSAHTVRDMERFAAVQSVAGKLH